MRKNFLLCTLVAVFASMQISYADGLANASISSTQGGFVGMENGTNSATLNFNGNATVDWNRLHVGANETLNFNAVDGASGLTVLNRVTGQFSNIYGTINANSGISHLILSNPHGIIFDGANFNAAGDVTLTTQKLAPLMSADGLEMYGYTGVNELATQSILSKNSNFNVGGTLKMVGPKLFLTHSNMNTPRFRLVTRNGQDFLVNNYEGGGSRGACMRAVNVNGSVYIVSGEDPLVIRGGDINGDLSIYSQGDVNLNHNTSDTCPNLRINGDLIVNNNGNGQNHDVKMRNLDVRGYLDITNRIGDVIMRDTQVENNLNSGYDSVISAGKGYNSSSENVVLLGNNTINEGISLKASGNVIIGNQKIVRGKSVPGSLNVQNGLYIKTFNGNVLIKDNVNTNLISIDSAKNILTAAGDGSVNGETAMLNADYYGLYTGNGYTTGAIENADALDNIMNNQAPINDADKGYMNISGGTVHGTALGRTSDVRIKAHDDLTVASYKADKMYLTAVSDNNPLGSDITINNINANEITIGGETGSLYVPQESRNYNLKFTNIRDNEVTEIAGNQAITYEDFNAPGGHNDGVQTQFNTWVDAPTEPSRIQVKNVNKAIASELKALPLMTSKKKK